jgi:membrane-bound lytic murein transglycosylase D
MRFFAAALFFFGAAASYGQAPEVPHKMQFAGMTLTIRDDAQREIQKDVDALTQHSRYYTLKAERAKTYFPIIEKIFEEERVPADFKYLVLQESALVPDAVSVSNAVGFWQFKDFTAIEMGLRVDKDIDERMNLISSTRGAARYLKQSNFYFNNWVYALQSYQMGTGGVRRAVGEGQNGAKHMEITSDTYWYVKKFLAHKIAFESLDKGDALIKVIAYQADRSRSLKEIAEEVSLDETVLRDYNKWLKTEMIPVDKPYTVLIPAGRLDADFNKLVLSSTKASKATPIVVTKEPANETILINDIPAIRAMRGESVSALTARAGISLAAFLKYNDIAIDHVPEPGSVYLKGKKKSKASETYYKVRPGDNFWSVSQLHGVRIKSLLKYNRMQENESLAIGSLIWLNSAKPKEGAFLGSPGVDVVQLNEDEAFDWYTKTPRATEVIPVIGKDPVVRPAFRPDSVQNTLLAPADASNNTRPQSHIARQGDTFYSIARQYRLAVADLLRWNNVTIQDGLKPGQILTLVEEPAVVASQAEASGSTDNQSLVHEVKSSDTLYSIARQFNVTIRDLMEWNNKKDFTVTVGEKLRIMQK